MAEEKTATVTGPSGQTSTVPIDKQGRPETIKYLGTDFHSKAVLEGRFFSNVGPRKSGFRQPLTEDWECVNCGHINRPYMVRCWNSDCGAYR